MAKHSFEEGDVVTPNEELKGITFPIGVEGVILTATASGEITVAVKHKDAYRGDSSTGFPPDHTHRYCLWHNKIRLVRRPPKT